MGFKELDPLLHQQLRLQIITLLSGVEVGEFNFLLDETGATRGNLSVQLKKLQEAGYIKIEKSFRNNYPLTECSISEKGRKALEAYVDALEDYFKGMGKRSGKKEG